MGYLDSLEDDKLESYQKEEFVKVKDNRIKIASIGGGVLGIIIITVFIVLSFLNNVVVPDMSEWTMTEVQVWTTENKIKVIPADEYDLSDSDTVIFQSITAGETIDKGDTIQITFSKGPNPNEIIEFPKLSKMMEDEIKEWVKTNKLTGITFKYEYSAAFDKDEVIKYNLVDGSESEFKRKNRVQITISKGEEQVSDLIEVPKLIDLLESQAAKWASDNGIELIVEYTNDNYVAKGKVITQSISQGYEVRRGDSVTVTISLGKIIAVPDFEFYTKADAESWAQAHGITIRIEEVYDASIAKGHLVSQSIEAGEGIGENEEIVISYSLGTIDIYSYVGRSILDFKSFIEDENVRGARLTYEITYESSQSVPNGSIISHEYQHTDIEPGTIIKVVVSNGHTIIVPDFRDLTVEQSKEWASENGVILTIKYEYASNIQKGYAKRQSIERKTEIQGSEEIIVYFSLGLVNIDSFEGMTIVQMRNAIDDLNREGANIKLQEEFAFSTKPYGTIISHEREYDEVIPGTAIGVIVSKGEAVIVPDFVNDTNLDTFEEALAYCNANGLNCTWKFDEGGVMNEVASQSVQAYTAIGKREEIEIHIYLG